MVAALDDALDDDGAVELSSLECGDVVLALGSGAGRAWARGAQLEQVMAWVRAEVLVPELARQVLVRAAVQVLETDDGPASSPQLRFQSRLGLQPFVAYQPLLRCRQGKHPLEHCLHDWPHERFDVRPDDIA